MFTVEKTGPAQINVEIAGSITATEMSEGLDALLPMIRGMEGGSMLMLYHDLDLPEAGAVMEEMKRLPQIFGALGHITKVAVVSDQKWVRDMAELEGMVLPGTVIHGFAPEARGAAEAFLTSASDTADFEDENFPV